MAAVLSGRYIKPPVLEPGSNVATCGAPHPGFQVVRGVTDPRLLEES